MQNDNYCISAPKKVKKKERKENEVKFYIPGISAVLLTSCYQAWHGYCSIFSFFQFSSKPDYFLKANSNKGILYLG